MRQGSKEKCTDLRELVTVTSGDEERLGVVEMDAADGAIVLVELVD